SCANALKENLKRKMDFEENDPLLDALLDEVLAGRTPPDLTARVLQAYAARRYSEQAPEPPPILAGVQQAWQQPVANLGVQSHAIHNGRQRRGEPWSAAWTVGIAAAIV